MNQHEVNKQIHQVIHELILSNASNYSRELDRRLRDLGIMILELESQEKTTDDG